MRAPAVYVTTLSGDLGCNDGPGSADNAENSYHVVTVDAASPILDGFTVTGGNANSTPFHLSGAGVWINEGNPSVIGCTFTANAATFGGGVSNVAGSPTLVGCVFRGNSGSGMSSSEGNPKLINCVFSRNSAQQGGGMRNSSSNSTLVNCWFDTNSASVGGGMYTSQSNPTLINCTFNGNSASSFPSAGGIHNNAGIPTLVNCILWGNNRAQIYQASDSTTVIYSCVQGGWAGEGNISVNPRLLANGHLRRGSPCIDSGNNTAVPTEVATDAAGNPRFVEDPETPDTGKAGDPPMAVVDMGAYEYEPVAAKKAYVNGSALPGGDGQSWSTAYWFLQDALSSTDPGVTEIWVAVGMHKPDRDRGHPNGTGNRSASFQLLDGVAIYGGFPAHPGQEGDFLARDPSVHVTVLSGDLAGNDGLDFANNNENSYHVVKSVGCGSAAVLDGFTISGGNADGTNDDALGGGMHSYLGSPTLVGCTFSRNSAYKHDGQGGGMYNSSSNPTLVRCIFRGNRSSNRGGGLYNYLSNPALTNCTFSGNSASYGGGVWDSSSSPVLTNCTLVGNSASASGGGISSAGTTVVTNCIVWGNTPAQIKGSTTVTHSCIQGGWPGPGNIDADPRLLSVQDGCLRVRRGSPCIDAGDNAVVPAEIMTDLLGGSRFMNDPDTPDSGNAGDPPRGIVDMGAYEYEPSLASPLYVKGSTSPGGDGRSWLTAYVNLQDALSAARFDPAVAEIWIAAGSYEPDRDSAHPYGSRDRAATFKLLPGGAVRGGFPGQPGQESDSSVRDPSVYVSVLSGDLAGNDGPAFANNSENSYHVVTANGVSPATILDGVTVSGGNANGSSPEDSGGGMYNYKSSPTLTNCSFSGNSANRGGAVYNYYSSRHGENGPTLSNCRFSGNAASYGGGIRNEYSDTNVINCLFTGNSGMGGAMYNYYTAFPG